MKRLTIIFIILMNACVLSSKAQNSLDLTFEQQEDITNRIVAKVNDFQNFLAQLADKTNSSFSRQKAYESILDIFIGRCDKYETIDLNTGRKELKDAVKMEISSVNSQRPVTRLMKTYLNNIKNNGMYSNIKISLVDAIRVGNLRKVAEGKYEATAHFCQIFIGLNGDKIKYSDKTEKAVKVYVTLSLRPTLFGDYDEVFDVKLGDIKVESTERL